MVKDYLTAQGMGSVWALTVAVPMGFVLFSFVATLTYFIFDLGYGGGGESETVSVASTVGMRSFIIREFIRS